MSNSEIPAELRACSQWISWKYGLDRNGKPTKIPMRAGATGYASSTDPKTWTTFERAYAGDPDYIGFVFADDPYVGIDLDGCLDPDTGEFAEWAAEIVRHFPGAYMEISPSLSGIKLWVRGRLPRDEDGNVTCRHNVAIPKETPLGNKDKAAVEAYDSERYFTVTGRVYGEPVEEIADGQAGIDWLVQKYLSRKVSWDDLPKKGTSGHQGPLTDEQVLSRARQAKNGHRFIALYDQGDISGYGSHSEADSALCCLLAFWTRDAAQIDRLFRGSALYREKWGEDRGAKTYGALTIERAMTIVTESYSPGVRIKKAREMAVQDADPNEVNTFNLTDAGNAELFAHLHGENVRFNHRTGEWLVWQGDWWQADADREVVRMALTDCRTRYVAATAESNPDRRKALAAWSISSESRGRIDAALDVAKALRPVADRGEGWDENPLLLGVKNGVVDLRTGLLRAGEQSDRIRLHTDVAFDPDAKCPRWVQFLDEVFEGRRDLIEFVRLATGYSLTGSVREHVIFFLFGNGRNGKGVLLNILTAVLGDLAGNVPFTALETKDRNVGMFDLAGIPGRRLITSSETSETSRLNEARIKALSGADPMTAAFKYRDQFSFTPVAKFWLAVNHLPIVRDDSEGFWERMRIIPFTRTFRPEQRDLDLEQKLKAELPGILAWAVEASLDWQAHGLSRPEDVMLATWKYREQSDPVSGFIADCCEVRDGFEAQARPLYQAYRKWGEGQGTTDRELLTNNSFGRRMGERFQSTKRGAVKLYLGIRLTDHTGLTGFRCASQDFSDSIAGVGKFPENSVQSGESGVPECENQEHPCSCSGCAECDAGSEWHRNAGLRQPGLVCWTCETAGGVAS